MERREGLTNEKLGKKFKNQFDLVNYAIRLAENMIRTGRETRIKTDVQNRAMQIIGEIIQDKDHFDEIVVDEEPQEVQAAQTRSFSSKNASHEAAEYHPEKKKGRKILAE